MTSPDTIPALSVLPQIFQNLTGPRGVRHFFAALCPLVLIGMLAPIVEIAVLVRWAKAHGDTLREPFGFEREEVPSATCISRTLAGLSLKEFRHHFAAWLLPLLENEPFLTAAVDGKTCRQGQDANSNPEVLLNVFLHDLKLAICSCVSVVLSNANFMRPRVSFIASIGYPNVPMPLSPSCVRVCPPLFLSVQQRSVNIFIT
jgi:hypothetical protein